eukprot:TRINITY_DN12568_c0_g1_i5.p1 TRINITY_DN12568_c0_g1~~TRINITY_DN12568_c0_g1_i5.p1  ORF type:complete len:741 (-),score=160.35 TRINITY_DN12568_c0_g1_i5:19-2202(-)
MLARSQGLAFMNTIIVLGTHGPVAWANMGDHRPVATPEPIAVFHMERMSLKYADYVVSPSHYLLHWMAHYGWEVSSPAGRPQKVLVQPNIVALDRCKPSHHRVPDSPIHEIVYFGRLQVRKGFLIFLDALDLLDTMHLSSSTKIITVTFATKYVGYIDGERVSDIVAMRARRWTRIVYSFNTRLGVAEAFSYLSQPGRMAMMPSLFENSPYTVLECLCAGVPFLASNVGGIPELLDPSDYSHALFDPTTPALLSKLKEIFVDNAGYLPRSHLSFDMASNMAQWGTWHKALAHYQTSLHRSSSLKPKQSLLRGPLVSLCAITTQEGIHSFVSEVDQQTYRDFEFQLVIIAPNATKTHSVEISSMFPDHRGQVHYLPPTPPGTALNYAADHSEGYAYVFMHANTTLLPSALETLMTIHDHTKADMVSSSVIVETPAWAERQHYELHVFTGGPAELGVLENCFGTMHVFVEAQTFRRLGGWRAQLHALDVWAFYTRAISSGVKLEVSVDPLFKLAHPFLPQPQSIAVSVDDRPQTTYEDLSLVLQPYASSHPHLYHALAVSQNIAAGMNAPSKFPRRVFGVPGPVVRRGLVPAGVRWHHMLLESVSSLPANAPMDEHLLVTLVWVSRSMTISSPALPDLTVNVTASCKKQSTSSVFPPVYGTRPSSTWVPGEVVVDERWLALPAVGQCAIQVTVIDQNKEVVPIEDSPSQQHIYQLGTLEATQLIQPGIR